MDQPFLSDILKIPRIYRYTTILKQCDQWTASERSSGLKVPLPFEISSRRIYGWRLRQVIENTTSTQTLLVGVYGLPVSTESIVYDQFRDSTHFGAFAMVPSNSLVGSGAVQTGVVNETWNVCSPEVFFPTHFKVGVSVLQGANPSGSPLPAVVSQLANTNITLVFEFLAE